MERLLADAEKLSGVHYDIDNLGDVYSAIHVIQDDLGLTGVAAAEASETFSGSFGAMKAAATNLLANLSLGEDIAPALDTLEQSVRNFLFNNLFPMVANVLQALPQLISGLGSMVIGALNTVSANADEIVQMGISIVTGLVSAIVEALPYLAEAGLNIIIALGRALIETDWIGIGTELISSLRDSIGLAAGEILGTDDSTIQGFITGIMNGLSNVITAGGQIISTLLASLLQNYPIILQQGATLLLNLVQGILFNLPMVASSIIQVIGSIESTVLSNLPTILAQGITIIGKLAAGLIQAIPTVVASIPQIIQAIVNAFGSFDWLSIGINIIKGIAEGLSNAVGIIVDAAKGAAESAFNAAKDFLGIHSPATKGIYIGEMLDSGIALGIVDNKSLVTDAITGLTESATTQLQTSTAFDFTNGNSKDDKMDLLLAMLSNYLPEIAENKGIDAEQLYNGLNRQLGWALS